MFKGLKLQTRSLLEQKCSELSVSIAEDNRVLKEAAEQQAMNGIAGVQNLKNFASIKYYALFEKKIRAVHDGALTIIDSCHKWEPLSGIPTFLDSKARLFASEVDLKILALSGNAPLSPEIKNINALYVTLKRDFDFKAKVLIKKKRQDFLLTAILIPVMLGLLWIVLRRI